MVENSYEKRNNTHVIVDYSDYVLMGDQNNLAALQAWEEQNMENATLIYNTQLIRVYALES